MSGLAICTSLVLAIGCFVATFFFDRIVRRCSQVSDTTIAWGMVWLAIALVLSGIWWWGMLWSMWEGRI